MREQPITEDVHLPTIAICLKEPFRDVMKHMLTLEEYYENTRDPKNESFVFLESTFNVNWTEYHLNTYMFGRCLIYETAKKVSAVLL